MKALILYRDFNKKEQIRLCEEYATLTGCEVVSVTNNVDIAKAAALHKEYELLLTADVESFGTDIDEATKNTVRLRNFGAEIVMVTTKKINAIKAG